jgi:hypothetical protein
MGGRPGQHDQTAVPSPGQVGRLDSDVGGGQVGQVLPAAAGGVQQPQVIAFLARSGQAVEPDGDVAAIGVDGGDVGAAAQPGRPPKPPTAVAGQVGQGERGLGFGAGQQQLAVAASRLAAGNPSRVRWPAWSRRLVGRSQGSWAVPVATSRSAGSSACGVVVQGTGQGGR